jgi:hypothetical protein
VQLRLTWQRQQVHDGASGVEAHRLLDGAVDDLGEQQLAVGALGAVDVGDVGAHDEGGLGCGVQPLQQRRLAGRELDRVGPGVHERADDARHVLDPGQEAVLAEEAVVDGDVEAAAVGCEEAVEARVHARRAACHGGGGRAARRRLRGG